MEDNLQKIPVIYSEKYSPSFEGHVFPVEKYRLIKERLLTDGIINPSNITEPKSATFNDLNLVHTKEYIDDLYNVRWTERTIPSELPISKEIVDFFILTAGGSILAAEKAVECGAAFHIGGGFHHAFADHAEGFCYINDIAVAVRKIQKKNPEFKFLVFDTDLHQGNGTANIFENDDLVFTYSIHQENLYPVKQSSNLDVGLSDLADDDEYLSKEKEAIDKIFSDSKFDLTIYVAGADPFVGDQLGTLQISKEGLKERDIMLFKACRGSGSAICVVLAGGYAPNTNDVVDIHMNTFIALKEVLAGRGND